MLKTIAAFFLIIGVFLSLIGLGFWQLQRMEWKAALIEEASKRPLLQILRIQSKEEWQGLSAKEALSYRRALITGRFLQGKPLKVFTVLSDAKGAYEGPGYWMIHPFQLVASHTIIFVNMGFVPEDKKQLLEKDLSVSGVQTLEGIIRENDPSQWLTPDPDFQNRLFYTRDIERMQAYLLEVQKKQKIDIAPFNFDLVKQQKLLPQAGETKMTFSDPHLGYAITWFGLAFAFILILCAAYLKRRKTKQSS